MVTYPFHIAHGQVCVKPELGINGTHSTGQRGSKRQTQQEHKRLQVAFVRERGEASAD